jgi:hypothetical protein
MVYILCVLKSFLYDDIAEGLKTAFTGPKRRPDSLSLSPLRLQAQVLLEHINHMTVKNSRLKKWRS